MTHAGSPTPERVHHVRTTARRLEAVLRVCYPEPTSRVEKLIRRLKKLRRRAGAVRDVDVQTAALRSLKIGREGERKSRLMAYLADARAAAEADFESAVHAANSKKFPKRLRRVAAEIAQVSAAPQQNGNIPTAAWMCFDPVPAALRLFARATRETKALTPENLHAYRTRCKRIRYVAEMAGNSREAKRVTGALKRLQDAVGDWHDWVTLTATAEELFARSLDSALVAALRNISGVKFSEAKTVAEDVRRELMRMYRDMLAVERERRQRTATERRSPAAERRKPVAAAPKVIARAEVA